VGPLGCLVVHACSDSGVHYSALNAVAVDRCARSSRCSAGTPDSPVNYSGVPSDFPEGGEFSDECPGAPDTFRWHTGQSGAPNQGAFRDVFCSLYLNPFLGLFIGFL
jgi:hypothetical protein